jgi:hypothetical protein
MGCVQAWSAHGDLWWKKFVSFSGKLGWALGRDIEIQYIMEKGKRK